MSSTTLMANISDEMLLGCLDIFNPNREEYESELSEILPEIRVHHESKVPDKVNKNETKNKAILLYAWLDSLLDFPQSDLDLEMNNIMENPKSENVYEKNELNLTDNLWDIWNGKSLDIKFLGSLKSFPVEYTVKDTDSTNTPISRPVNSRNNRLLEKTTDYDNTSWDLWQGNTIQLDFGKHDLQKKVKSKSENLRTDWLKKRHLFPPVGTFFGHTGTDCSCHVRTSRPLFKRQEVPN